MDRWNRIADPLGNGVKKTNQSETNEIKNFWGYL